ncbi:MAG: redoxin domain-containing protein [Phycisphaeraceae bacterium]
MTTIMRVTCWPSILAMLALALALPACDDTGATEMEGVAGGSGAAAQSEERMPAERAEPGELAPAFTLTGSDGETYSLSDFRGQWVILEWINHDCPYVRKFYNAGAMQALQRQYTEQDVVWLSICSSAAGKQGHESPERWNELTAEKDAAPTAVLIDDDGTVGRAYQATNTPHMYVIDPAGELVYMGAIDSDSSASAAAIETADNYVTMVMDAVLAGEAAPIQYTDAYGCTVHYPD